MTQLLWRIDGEPASPDRERWQQGLTLHLLFQPVTLIIARRDGQTRHYLALAGCPSCRPEGCDRVCHRVLFEQLIRTALPGLTLTPTARLVPRTTERRRVIATPRNPRTAFLDAAFLAQWAEGRLITTWSRLKAHPRPVCVGVMLAVSQDGPAPEQMLRPLGWTSRPLATRLYQSAFERLLPGPVPIGLRADAALFQALRDPMVITGQVGGAATTEGHAAAQQPDHVPAQGDGLGQAEPVEA
jgi:hypothetical protein